MRKALTLTAAVVILLSLGFTWQESHSQDGRKLAAKVRRANALVSVMRGPYLQTGTPTQMTIRWRTDTATDGRVQYGSSPVDLASTVDHLTVATEHEILLSNLSPGTQYYYSVGSTTATLASGADYYFFTAPAAGGVKKTRVWVLGDAGTANSSQQAVREAYYNFTGVTHTDLWVMLGDNAYNNGTDSEYEAAVFDMYPTMLRKSVLWPAFGNHDAVSANSPAQSGVFYNIFTLPKQGEAGGVASGTEAYYSFDFANIHFICLNSEDIPRTATGAMLTWLQQDLAANTKHWTMAFWHHPPYSKGSHDSDSDSKMTEMRANALPILENGGVDLVLTGHSHAYERSFLLDGHYGTSGTLTNNMKLNFESGRENSGGAYTKPVLGPASHQGAVYVVAGSSGKISGGSLNHPAMFFSLNALGSLVLDVDNNRLDATFLDNLGNTRDSFTIIKGASPVRPSNLSATTISGSQINLAWTDNSTNEESFKIYRKTGAAGTYADVTTVGADIANYSDAGLAGGVTYYYRVRAFNAGGSSSYSNEASATTSTTSPSSPSNLMATALSSSQINLAWTDNSNNETGFKIERKTGAGGTYAQITTTSANVTNYSNTGLTAGTTYYYQVRAYNAGGNSAYSSEANATTQNANPNLARSKPAAALTTNGSNSASRAVDGSTSTYWRSGSVSTNTMMWWRVDLGAATTVSRVVIKWRSGSYYARKYQIQVSSDNVSYATVYTDNAGNGGTDNVTFIPQAGRYVRVYMTQNNSSSERIDEVEVYASASAALSQTAEIETSAAIVPAEISLAPNYPNPFGSAAPSRFAGNPATTISYALPEDMHITLKIVNLSGQEVATLANGYHERGSYRVTFDAAKLPSGLYFSVLQAGEVRQVRRMIFMK